MLNPPIVNDIAKIHSALTVKFNSLGLSPTKIQDKGIAKVSANANIKMPKTIMIFRLLDAIFCSSE